MLSRNSPVGDLPSSVGLPNALHLDAAPPHLRSPREASAYANGDVCQRRRYGLGRSPSPGSSQTPPASPNVRSSQAQRRLPHPRLPLVPNAASRPVPLAGLRDNDRAYTTIPETVRNLRALSSSWAPASNSRRTGSDTNALPYGAGMASSALRRRSVVWHSSLRQHEDHYTVPGKLT